MGYNFQLVALPIEQLAALHACRDSKLFRRVLETPGYVQYLLGRERGASETREEMEGALRAIVLGSATSFKPYRLAYAVEACCYALGTPAGAIDTRDADRIEAMLKAAGVRLAGGLFPNVDAVWPLPLSCHRKRATERTWPLDPAKAALFPDPGPGYGLVQVDDYPLGGYLSADEVRARYEVLVALPYADTADPSTDEEIALSNARHVFANAGKAGTDVIVFLH
jgi:hypothetical protein